MTYYTRLIVNCNNKLKLIWLNLGVDMAVRFDTIAQLKRNWSNIMTTFNIELTDTFAGESNYSWVKRTELTTKKSSRRAIVQAAKAWAGYTGLRCIVEDFGDMITLRPQGICHIMFITLKY
jgi:hypothetical protein